MTIYDFVVLRKCSNVNCERYNTGICILSGFFNTRTFHVFLLLYKCIKNVITKIDTALPLCVVYNRFQDISLTIKSDCSGVFFFLFPPLLSEEFLSDDYRYIFLKFSGMMENNNTSRLFSHFFETFVQFSVSCTVTKNFASMRSQKRLKLSRMVD